MFHVSQLKKCLRVPNEAVEIEGLALQPDLMYIEHPVKILDEKERVTRNNVVKFYKVQWQNHSEDEATWEQESYILKHYPHLLSSSPRCFFTLKCISYLFSHTRHMKSQDEILFKGGRFVTSSVLHRKSFTKTCHEHHVYVLMQVIKCVDQFLSLETINGSTKRKLHSIAMLYHLGFKTIFY